MGIKKRIEERESIKVSFRIC